MLAGITLCSFCAFSPKHHHKRGLIGWDLASLSQYCYVFKYNNWQVHTQSAKSRKLICFVLSVTNGNATEQAKSSEQYSPWAGAV